MATNSKKKNIIRELIKFPSQSGFIYTQTNFFYEGEKCCKYVAKEINNFDFVRILSHSSVVYYTLLMFYLYLPLYY